MVERTSERVGGWVGGQVVGSEKVPPTDSVLRTLRHARLEQNWLPHAVTKCFQI